MQIKQMLIPESNKFTRPGVKMEPQYITLHETANTTKGATALAHAKLQQSGNSRQASWHYSVDSLYIIQSVPDNEVAFHAGDGAGDGNRKSIGIEICVNEDGDFDRAKEKAIQLIRDLMDKHKIPLKNVVPHKHWSGKNCPKEILKEGWDKFISDIASEGTREIVEPLEYPGKYIRFGSRGGSVKMVQEQLGGLVVDGIFGKLTLARVKEFQKANKLDVDGIVGPVTWGALFN